MSLEGFLKYPLVILAAFGLTFILVPWIKKLAVIAGAVDLPGERRLNEKPVPRAGGLAVYLGFQAACALIFWLRGQVSFAGNLDAHWWQLYLGSSTLLLIVGLLDDVRSLSWSLKLSGQILAACAMFAGGINVGQIQGLELPPILDFFCTVGWFLLLTNAFNLIDGLDGLATGLALIAAVGLAVAALFKFHPADALVLLALAGACLAFLRYNFHPASVFLGDSGSMFLGFTLAAVALASNTKGTTFAAIGVPLLAAGVPLLDTLLAVWRRSVRALADDGRAQGIVRADMEHLHHRLIRIGFSQSGVALWLYSMNLLLVSIGLLGLVFHSQAFGILTVTLVLGLYVIVRHLARVELWDSGKAILRGLRRPSRPIMAALLYPAFDALVLGAALLIALLAVPPPQNPLSLRQQWLSSAPLWCGMPFICLCLSGIYARVWSRARIVEFLLLAGSLFAGVMLSLGILLIVTQTQNLRLVLQAAVYLAVAQTLILSLRAAPRVLLDLIGVLDEPDSQGRAKLINILIYGAGYHGTLYLRRRTFPSQRHQHTASRIAGFIDDDFNLRKRLVHGYRVLGIFNELPEIAENLRIDQIVIACNLPPEKKRALVHFCRSQNLTLKEWVTQENTVFASQEHEQRHAPSKAA